MTAGTHLETTRAHETQDLEMSIVEGSFHLPMSRDEAFGWFTPEGERAWADDWDPRYPAGRSDPEPGLVFEIEAHGEKLLWVLTDVDWGKAVEYVVVVPEDRAGTISVHVEHINDGSLVTVGYHMTALSSHGMQYIEHLNSEFPAILESWQTSIINVASRGPRGN
jgi:hypothetical protein